MFLESDAVGSRLATVILDECRPARAVPTLVRRVPGPAKVGDAVPVGPGHVGQVVRIGTSVLAELASDDRDQLGERGNVRTPARGAVAASNVIGVKTDHKLMVGVRGLVLSPTRHVIGVRQAAEHKRGRGPGQAYGVDKLLHAGGLVGDGRTGAVVRHLTAAQPARPGTDVGLVEEVEEHGVVGLECRGY